MTLEVNYDDSPDRVIERVNTALKSRGLRFRDDEQEYDGKIVYNLDVEAVTPLEERAKRLREATLEDAPIHMNAEEAQAWASGYNAALMRLGLM